MFNVIINSEQYDEFMAQKEKIKELEARNEFLKEQYDQLNEKCQANSNHYQGLYEELVQTVHENDKERELLYKNYQQAVSDKAALIKKRNDLLIENDELKNKVTRFGELVSENYRLRQSIVDLKANNKELKAKIKEPVATITINHCRDLEDAYSLDSNTTVKIENLYLTNNYFSEEDERDD